MGNFESSMDLDSDYEEYYNMYDEDETDEVSDHYLINIMLDRVVNRSVKSIALIKATIDLIYMGIMQFTLQG